MRKLVDISGDFRAEVAHRVSDDYGNRLRDVETELATHRSVLEGSVASKGIRQSKVRSVSMD